MDLEPWVRIFADARFADAVVETTTAGGRGGDESKAGVVVVSNITCCFVASGSFFSSSQSSSLVTNSRRRGLVVSAEAVLATTGTCVLWLSSIRIAGVIFDSSDSIANLLVDARVVGGGTRHAHTMD